MKNRQLKAEYNIQVGVHNKYVLEFTIHQNPTDVRIFQPHMEYIKSQGVINPKIIVADAGYESKENCVYCEENIKNSSNWGYNVLNDSFLCPNNRYIYFENCK
nr:transposase [Gemella sp. oral taxon 928]